MKRISAIVTFALGSAITLVAAPVFAYSNTPSIDSGYNSRIIDDSTFTNVNTMSTQDVQNFLNIKVPTCDTNHQGGLAQYPPPYTCLRNYVDPTTGKTAAALIHDESVAVGLNPQVTLVTLEKEQGLVTDTWPYPSQYKSAMGYGCPESQSVCDSTYYGFYNQVHLGVRLLRAAEARDCGDTSTLSSWYVSSQWAQGSTVTIDGRSTYLSNCATGALYNYTPHRPDSAYTAYNGTYFYGNYNFINYFTSWFGPTYGASLIEEPGDNRLFVLDRNVKHWVATGDVENAWGFENQTPTIVTSTYFNSIPTGSNLTRLSSDASGNVYLLDNGYRHWVSSNLIGAAWGLPNTANDSLAYVVPSNAMLQLVPEAEWLGRFAKSQDGSQVWLIDGTTKYLLPSTTDQTNWGLTSSNYTFMSAAALAIYTTGPTLGSAVSYNSNNYVVDSGKIIQLPSAQIANSWGISNFVSISAPAPTLLGSPTMGSDFVEDPSVNAWYMLTAGSKRYVPTGALASAWGMGSSSQNMTFVSTAKLASFSSASPLSNYVTDSSTNQSYVVDGSKYQLSTTPIYNAWIPTGVTPQSYDSNSLARLSTIPASTIVQAPTSSAVYTLDHGAKLYIGNGMILSGWGAVDNSSIQVHSADLMATLANGANASNVISSNGVTYLIEHDISHVIPANLITAWGATNPTPVSADALARFTSGPQLTPFINVSGTYYAVTGGQAYKLGNLAADYGATTNAVSLDQTYLPISPKAVSYSVQSSDSTDPRAWIVTGGQKFYVDSFARWADYGFVSRGLSISYLDPAIISSLTTQSGMAPICINKAGAGVKYLSYGSAYGFADGATLTNTCTSVTTVSASLYDSFPLIGAMSQVVQDATTGQVYFITGGIKRWITNPVTYNASYRAYPLLILPSTTLSLVPTGSQIN